MTVINVMMYNICKVFAKYISIYPNSKQKGYPQNRKAIPKREPDQTRNWKNVHNAWIVRNWNKSAKKGMIVTATFFFELDRCPDEGIIRVAKERYKAFMMK